MYPSLVALDRRVPDEETVRERLADSPPSVFDGTVRLDRLHRVLYPVFHVTCVYEADSGLFGRDRQTETTLVDGLWNGNDPVLTDYCDAAGDPERASLADYDLGEDTPGLGTTVVLEFQATNDRAAGLLGQRMAHVRSRRDGG